MTDSNTIFFTDTQDVRTHPFSDKRIVFTGALSRMTRSEAAKGARNCGAVIQGAVTRETDFVVLGKQRHNKSTKQRKAEQLISMGCEIQIIEEEDFYWILSFGKE